MHFPPSDKTDSGFPPSEAGPHDLLQLLTLVDPVDGDEARRHHVQQVATVAPKAKVNPKDCDEATSHHTDDGAIMQDKNALILNNLAKITNKDESLTKQIVKPESEVQKSKVPKSRPHHPITFNHEGVLIPPSSQKF